MAGLTNSPQKGQPGSYSLYFPLPQNWTSFWRRTATVRAVRCSRPSAPERTSDSLGRLWNCTTERYSATVPAIGGCGTDGGCSDDAGCCPTACAVSAAESVRRTSPIFSYSSSSSVGREGP